MIEILERFPGNVIAATMKGRLTRSDYEDVLIPKAGAVFSGRTRARCYYEVGSQFTDVDANCDVGPRPFGSVRWQPIRLYEHSQHHRVFYRRLYD